MSNLRALCLCVAVGFLLSSVFAADDLHGGHDVVLGNLGTVNFQVRCSQAAQRDFPHAVALLHSFAYEQARAEFTAIAKEDPKCAMAYWGEAMTWWHPLWNPPGGNALRQGFQAIEKAAAMELTTGHEMGYVAALRSFYSDYDKLDYRTRAMKYRRGMARLHKYFPKDSEVSAFYALSILATAPPGDKTYRDQHEAAAILEKVFAEEPDHPGAAHYLIYSFDNPALAKDALLAARSYARVAPPVPHALHMPSHIFTRLGLWQESVNSNLAAEQAAKQMAASANLPYTPADQLHAMDYLIYAYLQQGHDQEASGVLNEVTTIQKVQPGETSFYALAAIPARYAVERGQWAAAAALVPNNTATPETQAITYWARALGAAHLGKFEGAHADLSELERLHGEVAAENRPGYDWAARVEIERREAAAWLAHAQHEDDKALSLLGSAIELEDATGNSPMTPGAVLPARDLMADLLMELHRPRDAFQEYESSLKIAPHRFHAVQGAERAAEAAADHATALKYRRELQAQTGGGGVQLAQK